MLSGSSLPVGAPPLSSTLKRLYPKEIERERRRGTILSGVPV